MMPTLTETLRGIYGRKCVDAATELDNAMHNYCGATRCGECAIGAKNCVRIMESTKAVRDELKTLLDNARD